MAREVAEKKQVVTTDDGVENRQVDQPEKSTLAVRIVSFIVGFIVTLLALRILLLLLAANQGNAFVDFVYGLSGVFAVPFYGIFDYEPVYGESVFEISSVVAILVYALIGWGIAKLLTINSQRQV